MRGIALAVLFTALTSTFSIPGASAKTYGAIAVVWGPRKRLPWHRAGSTRASARTKALVACHNGRCKIATSYGPGQCIFVVLGTSSSVVK
jgi:hypothetical protein